MDSGENEFQHADINIDGIKMAYHKKMTWFRCHKCRTCHFVGLSNKANTCFNRFEPLVIANKWNEFLSSRWEREKERECEKIKHENMINGQTNAIKPVQQQQNAPVVKTSWQTFYLQMWSDAIWRRKPLNANITHVIECVCHIGKYI